jgi:hypothetical protein
MDLRKFGYLTFLVFSNVADGGNGNGGAIYSSMYSEARIKYSQFLRNQAVYGGAIYGSQESKVEIIESKFESNQALIAVSGHFASSFNPFVCIDSNQLGICNF